MDIDISSMKKPELCDAIVGIMSDYSDPDLGLTGGALNHCNVSELRRFYEFLLEDPCPTTQVKRPGRIQEGKSRWDYKNTMTEYIGFDFEQKSDLPESLLESTANYLEDRIP